MTEKPLKSFVVLKPDVEHIQTLVSLGQWYREQREQSHRHSSIAHILNPFWRSMAINAYDLFERKSLEDHVRRFVASAFGAKRAKQLHTLVNLRLKLGHHSQRTGEILETFLFTETQFDNAGDKPCVVITMMLDASADAQVALQLRSPSFPIGAQARYAMAYESNNGTRLKKPVNGIFTDPPFNHYSETQREHCLLVSRYVNRGAFLYEELRAAQQFETLALLVSECQVKAIRQEYAEQRKHESNKQKGKKKKKQTDEEGGGEEGSISLSDSDDEAAVVSDNKDVEYDDGAANQEQAAAEEKSFSSEASGDDMSSLKSVQLSDDDAGGGGGDDGDDLDMEAAEEEVRENRPVVAVARERKRIDRDDDDDDVDDKGDKDDAVPLESKPIKRKLPPAPPSTAVDISKRQPKIADVEPMLLDVARPDELQWARMIVARRAYCLTLKISCVTPGASQLMAVCRQRLIPIEAGVTLISQYFAEPDTKHMKFYVCNVANLAQMAATEKCVESSPVTMIINVENHNVPAVCDNDDLVAVQQSKPLVEAQPMPQQDYRDERHATVLPDKFPGEWHPLDDIKTLGVDVCSITLYEITCYTRQRLAILLAAFRGYYLSKSYEEKRIYVDAIIKSQYPVRSGASYYIVRTLKGAQAREMMHEGIGLSMLCMIAKSNAALHANLVLMEMCLVKHRIEQQTLEYADRDAEVDSERSDVHGQDEQYVESLVKTHAQRISEFFETCENVLSDEWAAEVANDAEKATYDNFFQILGELSSEWQEALRDIEDKTADDDEDAAPQSQQAHSSSQMAD